MSAPCAPTDPEARQLLVQAVDGGAAGAPVTRGRRLASAAATTVLGASAVLLAAAALLAPGPLRGFAGHAGIVGLHEIGEEESSKEPKEGYHFETQCGTDYTLQNVVHNNLGGAGPDTGKEGIVYNASQSKNGKFERYILVKVDAVTKYDSESSDKNGMDADFGSIRVDPGTTTKLKFSFFSQEDKELTLEIFRITFYDLDEAPGHHSKEFIIENGGAEVDTSHDTDLKEHKLKSGIKIEATTVGRSSDNPKDSTTLTHEQQHKAVVLSYENVDSVEVTLGSTDGKSPRNFAFALHSALACKQVEVKDDAEENGAPTAASPAARSLAAAVAASLLLAPGRLG